MSETPFESPAEDLAEQRSTVIPDDDNDQVANGSLEWNRLAWDADPADAQEQVAEVPIDEDEWR